MVTWLLPVTVPVGSPSLYIIVGNREEIHGALDKFPVPLRSVAQEVSARAADDAHVPDDQHTLHCALGSVSSNSHNSMFPTS